MTEKFEITQLTPELRRLLEIIKDGRDHTGQLLMLIDSFDPMTNGHRDGAALAAGIFGAIGNVINAITNSMLEDTKTEALEIVYGKEEPAKAMETDLSVGGAVMSHLLVKALTKAAKENKLGEIKLSNPELLGILSELGAPDTDPVKGKAEAAKEFFEGISDEQFADAELKMGGYVGPTGKHNN
jgi:hypothetical protein